MLKEKMMGVMLLALSLVVSREACASDPLCAGMKTWKKIAGYSYDITEGRSAPEGNGDFGSDAVDTLLMCNAAGDALWRKTYTSESIELILSTEDLNGDKIEELIVDANMGAAYSYQEVQVVDMSGPGFRELGSFRTGVEDGRLDWEDLNHDGVQEAIMDRTEIMGFPTWLPEVQAFGAGGLLALAPLKDYPKLVESSLDGLYDHCAGNKYIDNCAAEEATLQAAKRGTNLELTPSMSAPASSIKHAAFAGWSEDSAEFGYCAPTDANPAATRCEFASADLKTIRSVTDEASGALLPEKTKEISVEAAKKHVSDVISLRAYPDLLPVWKLEKTKKGPVLSAGVQRLGNRAAYGAPITIDLKAEGLSAATIAAHPEVISVSPDGTRMGLLVHFSDGVKSVYRVKVLSLAKLAGNAYNIAGLEFHKKEMFGLSAPLFAKSVAADPDAKWPLFNLACAYARLGDESKATINLEKVIAQKNPEIMKQLATDTDLNSLRGKPWFPKVGP